MEWNVIVGSEDLVNVVRDLVVRFVPDDLVVRDLFIRDVVVGVVGPCRA